MSAIEGTRPRDGEARMPVEATPVEAIGGLVARARDAGFDHAARPLAERAGLLRALADAILADGEAIVALLEEETGKPAAEAWLHEVVPTADLGSWWSSQGPAHLATEAVRLDPLAYPGKRARVEVVPRGVVALITPWNFPVAIPLRTLFPALLAGNGVVWKPSEHTPRVAARVHGIVREVFGPDLVELVQGAGAQGAALVEADVDAVVFTGSVATGRKVGAAAGRALTPASLELGGKDAAVVLDDADLERTARGLLWAAMANAGQNCAGLERVYAVAEVAGPLKARLGELAGELVPGRDVGPLVTEAQLATVERHVREAVDGGAEVLAGGERLERGGRWFAPTVLAEVEPSSAALREETFGPVVVVQTVA
ncbi:MAG TPA: aldehyde dehydrogenase family protein, partial [Polyangiaceae bacterium LLY-WYZ-15_(1-7)]|nr:aldehyde dehydrogenase family protein [Polyangiaceae bacterium LLY-WYZ-15_(1-7)]